MKCLAAMLASLSAVWLLSTGARAESGLSRGPTLVNACAACHGPDGRSQGAIPSIDRLSPEDFIAALKAFRADTRKSTVMNRIARGIDDAEIAAMAAHFAGWQGR